MKQEKRSGRGSFPRINGGKRPFSSVVKSRISEMVAGFPYNVVVTDWEGNTYRFDGTKCHWCNRPFIMKLRTLQAGKAVIAKDGFRIMECFFEGDIDFEGNLYVFALLRAHAGMKLSRTMRLKKFLHATTFQDVNQSRVNVKSHYDIPQEVLDVYLDRVYMSYSCAMFEDPENKDIPSLVKAGKGQDDKFDSLEKAQWRKYKDAVDFIDPRRGETLLDVGCGYGGQLVVALENYPLEKVVGWTHSENQVKLGGKHLRQFDEGSWELNEGDYRLDERVYDHVTSTGMISHVGPRGLVPYIRNIRRRIRKGGRYVHHAIMATYTGKSLNSYIGPMLNKAYVWPGFHWFTIGEHLKGLEENGFYVLKAVNLSHHYEKTTAAWYERMMSEEGLLVEKLGQPTFRAWQQYLAGASGVIGAEVKGVQVFRVYCEAL